MSGTLVSIELPSSYAPNPTLAVDVHAKPGTSCGKSRAGETIGQLLVDGAELAQHSATVVVPAYNEARGIGSLLDALHQEVRSGVPIGLIIVEASGSTDGTVGIVRQRQSAYGGIRLMYRPERLGLAQSIQEALEQCTTNVVIRIDADVTFPRGLLGRLLARLDDPSIGILGPRVQASPTGRFPLDTVVGSMYVIHDYVSRISPKITNIQVFRRFEKEVLSDSESDDVMIQSLATESGLRALYVEDETVFTEPPRSLIGFIRQRVRCISAETWYVQRTRRDGPPTGRPSIVLRAIARALRSKEVTHGGLALFLFIEISARAYVRARYLLLGHEILTTWHSVR